MEFFQGKSYYTFYGEIPFLILITKNVKNTYNRLTEIPKNKKSKRRISRLAKSNNGE